MKTTGVFAALLFVLGFVVIGAHDTALASSFVPTDHTVTLSSSAVSANASLTGSFSLDSPNSLPEAHISFIPAAWSVADDAAIPNGAIVGTVSLSVSESVSNGPCNDSKFLSFTLYDATTNTSNLLGDNPRIPSSSWPGFADSNANNLPDAVDKYPTFLAGVYPGLSPRSRAYGAVDASIAGINRVANVLVFDPGTALPGMTPSASLGYIVVTVLQDPTGPAAASIITDQCSPFTYTRQDRGLTQDNSNTTANEGNIPYRANPAVPGTYKFVEYLRSQRDFDTDGIENRVDSCPYQATASWNPRISDAINDPDGDGIPGQDNVAIAGEQLLDGTGCDPTPLTANTDMDGDGFSNRQDNCPLTSNASQADPDADGIGTICDVVDTFGDGHLHETCSTVQVDVGSPGTPPTLSCPEFVPDMDGDGFSRTVEEHVGTGPQAACGNPTSSPPIYSQNWPADLSDTGSSAGKITLADVTSFTVPVRIFGTIPGDPNYNVRWDLVPDDEITLQDITRLTTLHPPMFEGLRAFAGPTCPWP